MTVTANGKRYTQARGRARREALITAARTLLDERDMNEITLPMVAEQAGIPASSTYHFFPDLRELYKTTARIIADEMTLLKPEAVAYRRWQDCVATFFEASAAYFNSDAAARQLLLGPQTAPEIKRSACYDDMRFGAALHSLLDTVYHLPQMTEPVVTCFYAIQLADTLFSLSVFEHGHITPHMLNVAVTASTSYLANYLPPILELRSDRVPRRQTRGRTVTPVPSNEPPYAA